MNKKKQFCTNLYPQTKVTVDGPVEFVIKNINTYGQIQFLFNIDQNVFIKSENIKKGELYDYTEKNSSKEPKGNS